ncbi:MAG: protease pro-enzyme activation domain-containing protein, partial [Candidatus Binataceae bacterium]|jgi:subtilase family serine protease
MTLKGNHPALADHSPPNGASDPQMPMTMRITLALHNRSELDQLLQDQQDPASPQYHQWLTPEEFDARFGPSQAQSEAVSAWLAGQGFQVTDASLTTRTITFTGTAAQAEQAFQTHIGTFSGSQTFTNVTDPVIPAAFAGVVAHIGGLDNVHSFAPVIQHFAATASGTGSSPPTAPEGADTADPQVKVGREDAFGPGDFYTFYDESPLIASDINGASSNGDCIGIVGVSDYLASAIKAFNSRFKLASSNITEILVDGTDPGFNSAEPESLIDLEWSHTAAPGAPQRFYLGSDTDQGLVDAISHAVSDNKCAVISISFGFCDSDSTFYTETLDPLFAQAASQGQSVFVSSGDQGTAGVIASETGVCIIPHTRNVNEMSADPNVTSVGGVSFDPEFNSKGNDVGSTEERVWDDPNDGVITGGATGGGASAVFSKPGYQAGEGVPSDGARDVPDIALMASPFFPGMVVADDRTCDTVGCDGKGPVVYDIYGGTSVSSPTFAGIVKLIEQLQGERLGSVNPKIYSLASSEPSSSGFRDITDGNNTYNRVTGFTAGPGYDQATGWGSVDIAEFAQAYAGDLPGPATLTISPSTLNFGQIGLGSSKSLTAAITNPKGQKAVAIISSVSAGEAYSASQNCNGALLPGATCKVSVTFRPVSSGTAYTTNLTIIDNAATPAQEVTLSGSSK